MSNLSRSLIPALPILTAHGLKRCFSLCQVLRIMNASEGNESSLDKPDMDKVYEIKHRIETEHHYKGETLRDHVICFLEYASNNGDKNAWETYPFGTQPVRLL
ncbi:hypothetical protein BDV12DRAFT_175725 [Aspergillus spectabilis]